MALITTAGLELEAAKKERFAILITGGDANANGLADLTVEFACDPPGPNFPGLSHVGPLTKDLPLDQALDVARIALKAVGIPSAAQAQVDMVVSAIRAAARLP